MRKLFFGLIAFLAVCMSTTVTSYAVDENIAEFREWFSCNGNEDDENVTYSPSIEYYSTYSTPTNKGKLIVLGKLQGDKEFKVIEIVTPEKHRPKKNAPYIDTTKIDTSSTFEGRISFTDMVYYDLKVKMGEREQIFSSKTKNIYFWTSNGLQEDGSVKITLYTYWMLGEKPREVNFLLGDITALLQPEEKTDVWARYSYKIDKSTYKSMEESTYVINLSNEYIDGRWEIFLPSYEYISACGD